MTKRNLLDLLEKIADLPKGQQRVAIIIIYSKGTTYQGVAEVLGLSLGTVYTHLKRIRDNHPGTYKALMAYRQEQLERRHKEALTRQGRTLIGGLEGRGIGSSITALGIGHGNDRARKVYARYLIRFFIGS